MDETTVDKIKELYRHYRFMEAKSEEICANATKDIVHATYLAKRNSYREAADYLKSQFPELFK